VLNHLQDCALDYARLDRVYLPQDDLAAAGIGVAALAADRACPGLRRVFDGMLDRTAALVVRAHRLPPGVATWRLRCETAVIVGLAARLLRRLRARDPLANRVRLGKADFLAALLHGLAQGMQR
jgi:phytoene/squalene synthetase